MEWLLDANLWIGFFTLVVLEIVLGIDNLIFIAILAEKLPPEQRDRARLLGLSLAMLMRVGLLTMISWIVSLTAPPSCGSSPYAPSSSTPEMRTMPPIAIGIAASSGAAGRSR